MTPGAELLALVVDAIPGFVFEWDPATDRVTRSEGLLALLGFDEREAEPTGAWWLARVNPDDAAVAHRALLAAFADPTRVRYAHEYRVRHRDGHELWVRDRGRLVRDAAGRVVRVVGMTSEVTERRRADADRERLLAAERGARAEAERAATREARLQGVTAALSRARTAEEVARAIVTDGALTVDALEGTVGLLVDDGATFEIVASTGLREQDMARWRRFPNAGTLPFPLVVRTREPVAVTTPAEIAARWPEVPELAERGVQAVYALPLVAEDEVLGALIFGFDRPTDLAPEYRQFCATLADLCAQAIARVRAVEAAHATRARLAETLDRVSDVIVEFDRAWRYRYGNACAREMIVRAGGDPDTLHAQPLWDVFPPLVDTPFHAAMLRAMEERVVARYEDTKFFGELWTEGEVLPTRDGVVVFARDVAHRKRAEAEREWLLAQERAARTEAERANRAKSEFLAVMSHELRTPLNAIGGYVDLLALGLRGPLTPEQAEDLVRLRRNQQHLLSLINDVLDFARIDGGRVAYDVRDVCLHSVLADVEALVAPQVRAKALVLAHERRDPPPVARADAEKVRQIVVNLVSNAVKFTPPGGRVTLSASDDGARVAIVVRDTGIGIPADKQGAIFEPFVQVNPSLTRTHEGTGLGLAISRDLARGMGGDLTVESVPGRGSAFTLTLPRA